ncbi:hypothetical protein O181_013842 [Austropuccinia psidii MF-1]|uniref:Prefoldin subunit 2 n=1 Tax=Austropuccinia psidii MF-1 TaxID=1389203 RepID=A0A9Q3BZ44_9BASI|nr:hypothetical protein [Austropuccinia psidii MF-1]
MSNCPIGSLGIWNRWLLEKVTIMNATNLFESTASQRPSNQEIVNTIRTLREEIQEITAKASQLERDSEEHSVVIETLKKTEPKRKCFRMIGGILMERTVQEILPDLQEHRKNIEELLKSLVSQYQKKNDEMLEYQTKWNVKVSIEP